MKDLFLLLSFFVIIFTSCEEKNEVISIANPKVEIPRIKSEIVEIKIFDRSYNYSKAYTLNDIKQVIKIFEIQAGFDTVIHNFSYKKDCIIEKKQNNVYSDSIHYSLNSNYKLEKTNFFQATIGYPELILYNTVLSKKIKNNGDFIIKYNDKGYISSINMIGYEDSIQYILEYKNDNINKISVLSNGENFIEENYEYYSNYRNTIGKENLYGNFLGKQNKNLIKKITSSHINKNTETYEYEYTFDKSNRVKTEKVVSKEENQIYRTSIRTFEYF